MPIDKKHLEGPSLRLDIEDHSQRQTIEAVPIVVTAEAPNGIGVPPESCEEARPMDLSQGNHD